MPKIVVVFNFMALRSVKLEAALKNSTYTVCTNNELL